MRIGIEDKWQKYRETDLEKEKTQFIRTDAPFCGLHRSMRLGGMEMGWGWGYDTINRMIKKERKTI